MGNTFNILLLNLLLFGQFDADERMIKQASDFATAYSDTTDLEDAMFCVLGIEAQPNKEEWVEFLQNNLHLDSAALDTIPPGEFMVVAQFVVDENGKICTVSIVKDPGYGLGERVKKELISFKGRWQPAKLNGRKTKSYRRQPIIFMVEAELEDFCDDNLVRDLIL